MEQAPAQEDGVAARVEGQGPGDEVLDRVERRGLRGKGGDLPHTGLADLWPHVDEDEPREALAVAAGPGQGIGAAQRHADEDESIEAEAVDEGVEVGDVALGRIVHLGRPLAVAVAPLVEGEAVALEPEGGADEIPGVDVEPAPVQEQHRGLAARAPVQIVEAHPSQDDVMRLGQDQFGKREPGGGRGQHQVRAELVGAQAHESRSSRIDVLVDLAHVRVRRRQRVLHAGVDLGLHVGLDALEHGRVGEPLPREP